jgi:hypothetical protein
VTGRRRWVLSCGFELRVVPSIAIVLDELSMATLFRSPCSAFSNDPHLCHCVAGALTFDTATETRLGVTPVAFRARSRRNSSNNSSSSKVAGTTRPWCIGRHAPRSFALLRATRGTTSPVRLCFVSQLAS